MRVDGSDGSFEVSLTRSIARLDRGPLRSVRLGERSLGAGLLIFSVLSATSPRCLAQDGHPTPAQTPVASSAEKPSDLQKTGTADSNRKKQISDESSQLLAMALSLKTEVDKTDKDMLSMKVIRKADEIERLAKTVKEKGKQGPGAS